MLDLGAGTGRYAMAAAERGAMVVAADVSTAMLEIARGRTHAEAVELVRADVATLPFADSCFDGVVAVTSLCFISDPARVLASAARVLRPGGRLVLGELNRWSLWALMRRIEDRIHATIYREAQFRGIRELRTTLADNGFTITRWEGLLHIPPLNSSGYLRAMEPIERFGRRCTPGLGAFLAIEARREDQHAAVPTAHQTA